MQLAITCSVLDEPSHRRLRGSNGNSISRPVADLINVPLLRWPRSLGDPVGPEQTCNGADAPSALRAAAQLLIDITETHNAILLRRAGSDLAVC